MIVTLNMNWYPKSGTQLFQRLPHGPVTVYYLPYISLVKVSLTRYKIFSQTIPIPDESDIQNGEENSPSHRKTTSGSGRDPEFEPGKGNHVPKNVSNGARNVYDAAGTNYDAAGTNSRSRQDAENGTNSCPCPPANKKVTSKTSELPQIR